MLVGPTVLLSQETGDSDLKTSPVLSPFSVSKVCRVTSLLWSLATVLPVASAALGIIAAVMLPECTSSSQDQFYAWSIVFLAVFGSALRIRAIGRTRAAMLSSATSDDGVAGTTVVVAGHSSCPYFAKAQGHADRLAAAARVYTHTKQEFGTRDDFQAFLSQWKQTSEAKAIGGPALGHRTCPMVWLAPITAEVDNRVAVSPDAVSTGSSITAFIGGCDDLGRLADEKGGAAPAISSSNNGEANERPIVERVGIALCVSLLVCVVSYAATS